MFKQGITIGWASFQPFNILNFPTVVTSSNENSREGEKWPLHAEDVT